MEYLDRERTYRLVRLALNESKRHEQAAKAEDLDAALTALDGIDQYGNTDHSQLRTEIKNRFATGIRRSVDADGAGTGYEIYTRGDVAEAIDQGYAETFVTRTFAKIVTATATIGTAKDMAFDFVDELGAQVEDVADAIDEIRKNGHFRRAFIRADRLAVALGSSALYMRWHEGGIRYQAVPPQSVYAIFAEKVESNGVMRAVDASDIDDATAIVVRLPDYNDSVTGNNYQRFLAYFGRSAEFPQGRCVVYRTNGGTKWHNIPAFGEKDVIEEYTIGDEPANPLTWAQNTFGTDLVPSEYPIVVILGQDIGAEAGLFPSSGLALWRDTMELDIATSRTVSGAIEGARGLVVVTADDAHPELPRTMSGAVAIRGGDVTKLGAEFASAGLSAMQTLALVKGEIANAHSVPAYQMVHDGTTAPVSGYSLDVQNLPLEQRRRERIALNEDAVERVFEVERGLIAAHTGTDSIPATVKQLWDPGHIDRPVDKKEKIENLKAAKAEGWIDYVDTVRSFHDLATDADAIALIESMAERKELYPGPSAPPTGSPLRQFGGPPPRPPRAPVPPPAQDDKGQEQDA